MNSIEFEEGYQAYIRAIGASSTYSNPYDYNSWKANEWENGWTSASMECML